MPVPMPAALRARSLRRSRHAQGRARRLLVDSIQPLPSQRRPGRSQRSAGSLTALPSIAVGGTLGGVVAVEARELG